MNTQEDSRHEDLLTMHEFYAAEARHQRSMMWDTVKWFTPILTAIHTGWLWIFINKFLKYQNPEIRLVLIVLLLSAIVLVFICFKLLKSFYGTNLKYITMLAKVEDELDFDERSKVPEERQAWSADDFITYEKYAEDRCLFEKAKDYVEYTIGKGTMHRRMRNVFYLFMGISLVELCMTVFY